MKLQREVSSAVGNRVHRAFIGVVLVLAATVFCTGVSLYCGGRDRAALERKLRAADELHYEQMIRCHEDTSLLISAGTTTTSFSVSGNLLVSGDVLVNGKIIHQ